MSRRQPANQQPPSRQRRRFSLVITLLLAFGLLAGDLALHTSDADARGFRRSRFRSSRRSWGGSRRRSTYRPKTRYRPKTTYRPKTRYRSKTTYRPKTRRRSNFPSSRRRNSATRRRRGSSSPLRTLYRANQARRVSRRLGRSRYGRRSYGRRSYGSSRGRLRSNSARAAAYRRAVAAGLAFATYEAARQHFAHNAAQRYPLAFQQEPTVRPAYVPATTEVNKEQRPVVWSDELKSYAVKKHGKLVPYDLLKDRAAATNVMATAGYFWGPKPTVSSARSSGGGWGWIFGLAVGAVVFLVFLIIGFVVLRAIRRSLLGGGDASGALAGPSKRRQPALKPPPGIRADDPDHPDFWMQLAVQDFVVIHDFQAFEDAVDGPKGVRYGDDFRVASLVRLRGASGGANQGGWDAVLAELEQIGMQSLFLLAWRQGGVTELSVYYVPNGFTPGTRTELLDRDETWLFQEPTRDDWRPGELSYNPSVTHIGTTATGAEVEQAFTMTPPGELAASATMEPATPPTLDAATVVKWRCATAEKNPLMLLVEIGGGADMAGGMLRLWLGTPVERHEVEVTPANIRS